MHDQITFHLQNLVDEPIQYESTSFDDSENSHDLAEKENQEKNSKGSGVRVRATCKKGKQARFKIYFNVGETMHPIYSNSFWYVLQLALHVRPMILFRTIFII